MTLKFRIDAGGSSSYGVGAMVSPKRESYRHSFWNGRSLYTRQNYQMGKITHFSWSRKVLNPLGGGVIYFLSRLVVKSKGEDKQMFSKV